VVLIALFVSLLVFGLFTRVSAQFVYVLDGGGGGNFERPRELDMVLSDPSVWVNRTVIVEGDLSGLLVFPAFESSPWDNELFIGSQSIGVSIGGAKFVNSSGAITSEQILNDYGLVTVYGVVEKGIFYDSWSGNSVTYYIAAEIVEIL
jgi:hypothetical protein